MHAVVLTGHGGPEKLEYRTDVPVPSPKPGEVMIRVGAAGINNTDINTRIGWYSKQVTEATGEAETTGASDVSEDGGWSGVPLEFPRIQGADVAGTIVDVGDGVDGARIGERVLVRPMQEEPDDGDTRKCITFGSEIDGGFAQYAVARDREVFAIESTLTDVELASFPCAYSTAEGLLHRAEVSSGDQVLVTGASGGVGSAAIQLARRRGAEVIAVASRPKWDDVRSLGATAVVDRGADLVTEVGRDRVDVVVDLVAGGQFPQMLDVLRPGGRYAVSGAIAGPLVELDVRTLYLKDLTLLGCTFQPREVFENLVGYIERGEIQPVIAATFPLADIGLAQQRFLEKSFTGKLVLVVDP